MNKKQEWEEEKKHNNNRLILKCQCENKNKTTASLIIDIHYVAKGHIKDAECKCMNRIED